MELIVTILLNLLGLIGTAIAIAFALVGKDVVKNLDRFEAQELPELKRRTARCLILFAVWTFISIPLILLLSFWGISAARETEPREVPGWIGLALLPPVLAGYRAIEFIWICFRSASALREPNTMTMWQSVGLFWTMIRGKKEVVLYSRREPR